ncbi:MAG: riboflavin synthase [Planctomycetes bacterium]|nr:riboflavin synthase [Planctomycetota bacterium]
MFTGIVEAALPITEARDSSGLRRISVDLSSLAGAKSIKVGDSVALNGCCLTVARLAKTTATFEAVPETLKLTNLGDLEAGSLVNVERAMLAGSRLDGHMVQGHVDATGAIASIKKAGGERRVAIACGEEFARQCVIKGSVCVDGISLTIAELGADSFTVAIIPHTWDVTNLRERKVGERVNLEADVIGKYVIAQLGRMTAKKSRVDEALMKKAGFI